MEENRALKKINDTRKKAKQIMDLKQKNDEMYEQVSFTLLNLLVIDGKSKATK